MKALKYSEIQVAKTQQKKVDLDLIFILDQIQSVENLAHIFRLADALSIRQLYLYKIPARLINQKTIKLSRSTIAPSNYELIEDLATLNSKIENYQILALEWTDQSQSLYELQSIPKKVALILGSESHGISDDLLSISDASVHLPMYGINSSINAAMALSIASYQIAHSNRQVSD